MKKRYRVGSYPINNQDNVNYGPWNNDKALIEAWVIEGNRKFPELIHFIDEE